MNIFKKMAVKNDFFKAMEGYSTYWRDLSLHYFESDVCQFNKRIEDELAFCLSTIVRRKITIIPRLCDQERIVFKLDYPYTDLFELKDGRIKSIGETDNLSFIRKVADLGEALRTFSDAYLELMNKYKTGFIPITGRVNFCYNFYDGYYFTLKDKNDLNKEMKICVTHSSDAHKDTDEYCYLDRKDLEVFEERIKIDPDYKSDLNGLNYFFSERVDKLKRDIGLVKIRDVGRIKEKIHTCIKVEVQEKDDIDRFIIREDNLFTFIEGVKCVRDEWKRYLRYIDLAGISFNDVYIAGLDFTGSNAIINPKLVYNRDIRNCVFDKNNLVEEVDILDKCFINDEGLECGKPIRR